MDQVITLSTHNEEAEFKARIAKTLAYYVAFVALGLAGVTLGPTLQGLADNTATRLSEISFLFVARSLGYMAGSLLGGRLYDRRRGHPVVATMFVIMAATLFLVPLIPLLWLLVAVLLVLGAAEGAVDVGGNTLLVWVHGSRVGPFMNGLHFCWGLGAFLSPILIAQAVLLSGDITLAYWLIGGLMFLPIIGLLRLPSPLSHKDATGRPNAPADPRLLVLIVAFFVLCVGGESIFGGWIFTYAVALGVTDRITAAYLTSLFWGALTLGRLLSIPLAARFEPRTILLVDLLGCITSVALIVLLPGIREVVWLGTFGMGVFMASMFPTMISYSERRMTITGQITSLFLVGAAAGGMTLPWLVGQLFEVIGPRVTMVIALTDLLLGLAIFAGLVLTSSRRTVRPLAD